MAATSRSSKEASAFEQLNELMRGLHDLDERSLVLSLAAFAEESLGDLLKRFMIPGQAATDLLNGFNAPLGTLSSRSKAAVSLGLITKDQFDDLERLRKIRNRFSHTWRPTSLKDTDLSAHVDAINYSNDSDVLPETALEKLRTSIAFLLVELRVLESQIEKKSLNAKLVGHRLVVGLSGDFDDQLLQATSKMDALLEQLESASGRQKRFSLIVLARWLDRLSFLPADTSSRRQTRDALFRKVKAGLQDAQKNK